MFFFNGLHNLTFKLKFFQDKCVIHIVIFIMHDEIMFSKCQRTKIYTQNLISRFLRFFNNCCHIYMLLAYMHRFLWILCQSCLLNLYNAAGMKKIFFSSSVKWNLRGVLCQLWSVMKHFFFFVYISIFCVQENSYAFH